MKNCMFSPFCQYSRFNDNNTLNEQEFAIMTNDQLSNRKLFSQESIHNSDVCGYSCPMWNLSLAQLKKNNLVNSVVLKKFNNKYRYTCSKLFDRIIDNSSRSVVFTPSGLSCNEFADILTYYGICKMWRYSLRNIIVYNLNFAKYISDVSQTFGNSGMGGADANVTERLLDLQDIINSRFESAYANVLIISGLDYVNFKGFKGEKLLELISIRESSRLPLIIVTPELSSLMGEGQAFSLLTGVLKERKVYDA